MDFNKEIREKLKELIKSVAIDDFDNFLEQNEILKIGLDDIEEAWNKHPDKVLVINFPCLFLIPKDTALTLLTLGI